MQMAYAYECGFRKNRSSSDQIFIIRQIMEKQHHSKGDGNK